MPRKARVISPNGMYHVIIRGINKQKIFEDDNDRYHFIDQLRYAKSIFKCEIYGFCLMGNHVHLLMKSEDEHIGRVMRVIGSNYVIWFNLKYERTGCLFQDRFRSSPIRNSDQFADTLRYIHQNPILAGLVRSGCRYTFSSFLEYYRDLMQDHRIKGWDFISKDFTYSILPRENFIKFHDTIQIETNKEIKYEIKPQFRRVSDDRASCIMAKISGCANVSEFQMLDDDLRKHFLRNLLDEQLPIDQLVRITGISRRIVQRLK